LICSGGVQKSILEVWQLMYIIPEMSKNVLELEADIKTADRFDRNLGN